MADGVQLIAKTESFLFMLSTIGYTPSALHILDAVSGRPMKRLRQMRQILNP